MTYLLTAHTKIIIYDALAIHHALETQFIFYFLFFLVPNYSLKQWEDHLKLTLHRYALKARKIKMARSSKIACTEYFKILKKN